MERLLFIRMHKWAYYLFDRAEFDVCTLLTDIEHAAEAGPTIPGVAEEAKACAYEKIEALEDALREARCFLNGLPGSIEISEAERPD